MRNRISPVEPSGASGETRELLERTRREFGRVPRLFAMMAHSPAALRGYLDCRAALARGRLPAGLREQLALLVAELKGCRYCVSAMASRAADAGLGVAEMAASRRAESVDPKAAAALRFATAVYDRHGPVTDDELASLRDAGFDDEGICEIIAHVALNSFITFFSEVLRPEIDFPPVPLTTDDIET